MLERIGPKESSYQICICVVNKFYMPMHSNQTQYKLSVPHGEMEGYLGIRPHTPVLIRLPYTGNIWRTDHCSPIIFHAKIFP